MPSSTPLAAALGPLETIVNVGWPGGVYVVISAYTEYVLGEFGKRNGSIIFSLEGQQAGGRLVADHNFHMPEDTIGTEEHPAHIAFSRYLAVLRFRRQPGTVKEPNTRAFTLKLAPSLKYDDLVNPGGGPPFCGESSTVTTWSNIYAIPVPQISNPNALLAQDVTLTTTTPNGSQTLSWTNIALQGATADDVGTGARSISGSDFEIWYQDAYGNYINTFRPCSELDGGPPPPATKTEGWKEIVVSVFPVKDFAMRPEADWNGFMVPGQLMLQKDGPNRWGGYYFETTIPRLVQGFNNDAEPLFDDLPQGNYEFRLARMGFSQFLPQTPPQLPRPLEINWSLFGTYPLGPDVARFDFRIGTNPPYLSHGTLPTFTGHDKAPFPPGIQPPSDQEFD